MKYDSIENILVVGERLSGKSKFVNNYIHNNTKPYIAQTTIGVEFFKKSVNIKNKSYLLRLWDSGSGLLYSNILDYYFTMCNTLILITRDKTTGFIKELYEHIKNLPEKYYDIYIIFNTYNEKNKFCFNEELITDMYETMGDVKFLYYNIDSYIDNKQLFSKIKTSIYNKNIENYKQEDEHKHTNETNSKIGKKSSTDKDCTSCCSIC